MRRTSSTLPAIALPLLVLFATGCSTTVRPEAKPIDPVPIFLTDYGIHSSLMLPTSDGRYVEYSFGDFGYAALNRGGPHNALGALLASSQAGIGRRFLSVRPGEDVPQAAYAPQRVQKLYANRFQVSALVKELDERFRKGGAAGGPVVHNPVTDNVFVTDAQHYSLANNCNHMTARMLRQLGCTVRGNTATSKFKVVGAQELPTAVSLEPAYAESPSPASGARARQTTARTASASYMKVDVD